MTDVVIVGAGIAGLIAANRTAELGCSTVLLEAGNGVYENNSRYATGAMNFAHSDPMQPPEQLVAAIMADTEDHADPELAGALAKVAARGLEWMQANGASFVRKDMQGKISWVLAPPRILSPGLDWRGKGSDMLLAELARRFVERGGTMVQGARGRKLVTDNGRVTGLEAEVNGEKKTFFTRAVIIADGGFQADQDLVRKHICKHPEKIVLRAAKAGFGDGIRMAEAVGARLVDMNRFYGHLLSRDAFKNEKLWPYPTMDSLTGGGILVDTYAQRLFDEGLGGITLANRLAEMDDPLSTWAIFDEEIWATTGKDEVVASNPRYVEAGGTLYSAPTIRELASKIGLPPERLAATVEAYNRGVVGDPLKMVPPRTPGRRFGVLRNADRRIPVRPVQEAPFYAIPLAAGISCTMGGLGIDIKARVQRADRSVIPGLYAAGDVAGGIMGGPIAGYTGGLAHAFCTALIAAESIAAEKTSA